MRSLLFAAAVALAFLLPSGVGADAEPKLYILHDVADDGFTYVGNPVHFGYILLKADRTTDTHKQGIITITLNGVKLYETSEDAGHDYNALNSFEVAFPAAGPYEVHATVPISGTLKVEASFHGIVYPNPRTTQVMIDHKIASVSGNSRTFEFFLMDQNGKLVPHTDALFEVRRGADNWLLFRTHLHSHETAMSLSYAFPQAGAYLVRYIGYNAFPSADGPMFDPAMAEETVTITDAPSANANGISGLADLAAPAAAATDGRYTLLTTVDPQDSNTPWSRTVLSGLVYDPKNDTFVSHVNFEAQLVKSRNGDVVFSSKTLHEYDGHYELAANLPEPGRYDLVLTAKRSGWSDTRTLAFTVAEVLPPHGTPLLSAPGAVVVTAQGLNGLKSGTPTHVEFQANNLGGTPAMHSEIDYQLWREGLDGPVLANKLHTHDSGAFGVDINFAEPGNYKLVVDPVTIHGDVSPNYYFGALGGSLIVPLHVDAGVPFPVQAPAVVLPAVAQPPPVMPGFGSISLLAGLGIALVLLVRRN